MISCIVIIPSNSTTDGSRTPEDEAPEDGMIEKSYRTLEAMVRRSSGGPCLSRRSPQGGVKPQLRYMPLVRVGPSKVAARLLRF